MIAAVPKPGAAAPEGRQHPRHHSSVRLQHGPPGVDLHQVRRPQGSDEQRDQQRPPTPRRDARDEERDGDAQHDAQHGHRRSDADRAQDQAAVGRGGEQVREVVEGELPGDLAREVVDGPERRHEEQRKRAEVAHDEPEHGQRQERGDAKARTAMQGSGAAARHARLRCDGHLDLPPWFVGHGVRCVRDVRGGRVTRPPRTAAQAQARRALQASLHLAYGTHWTSVRPSRHLVLGVFQ